MPRRSQIACNAFYWQLLKLIIKKGIDVGELGQTVIRQSIIRTEVFTGDAFKIGFYV